MPVKRHLPQAIALAAAAVWGVSLIAAPASAQAPAPAAPATPPAAAAPASGAAPAGVDMARAKQSFETVCSGCHEPALAMAQRHDKAGWANVVERMVGFGLTAPEAQQKEIVEYLAATYPPQ